MVTPNGYTPYNCQIINITNGNPGVVTTLQDTNYNSNLFVRIVYPIGSDVGMPEVNGNTYPVTPITSDSFSIGVDTTNFAPFVISPNSKQIPQSIPVSESGYTFSEAVKNNGTIKPAYSYKNAPEPGPR